MPAGRPADGMPYYRLYRWDVAKDSRDDAHYYSACNSTTPRASRLKRRTA
jgi:hypothetical protein